MQPIDTIPEKVEAANLKRSEGNDFFKQAKFREAFDKYEEAMNFFQHTYPKVFANQIRSLYLQFCSNLRQGDDEKLVNDTKLPILLNQAACQLKLKDCKAARLCCEKALDIDENNVKV